MAISGKRGPTSRYIARSVERIKTKSSHRWVLTYLLDRKYILDQRKAGFIVRRKQKWIELHYVLKHMHY